MLKRYVVIKKKQALKKEACGYTRNRSRYFSTVFRISFCISNSHIHIYLIYSQRSTVSEIEEPRLAVSLNEKQIACHFSPKLPLQTER
jgi:hypothetical protein